KDFMEYLRRPDSKQEFVKQWQDEYNSVADDTRNDDETRCELHECVDDLRERLWSICDERKQQAEDERTTTINDGWLDDRLGILSNHYITLIQAELDRFQDTTRLLKDYYRGMDGLIPDELKDEYSRIPLIELPVIERADSPAKSVTTETAADVDEMGSRGKSITPSAGAPPAANKRKSKETPEPQTDTAAIEESKPRIPLVPRRPVSPDPNAPAAQGKASKDKEKKKKQGDELETPPPPGDADEKLMFDAYWTAIQAIHSMMSIEQAAREAEEEAEKLRELEKQKDAEKASAAKKGGKDGGKGGKGGKKSRSPSPKKGKKEAAAAAAAAAAAEPVSSTTPVEEESEEEKAKKELKERKTQEYYFCLNEECDSCKVRLELIKCRGFSVLQDLKSKADLTFKSMNDWLGARFLKEMESIDYLSEVMRHHIESGERIDFELRLDQQDFMFNTDLKVIETPSPEPPATPIEQPMMEIFTVDQLVLLYKQFSLVAPEGVLSTKAFIDMIQDMTTLTHGMETLPDVWLNITPNQLQDIAAMISPDSEYIDWRAFLLTISQPLSRPTQTQLLQSLNCYKQMDQKNTGFVTREQFETVEFWFSQDIEVQPGEYDRLAHLKRALFDFFADHSSEPSKLDYVDMLMYFAVAPDSHEGFLRALTVAVGSHIPRLAKKQQTTAGDITDEDEMNPAAAAVSMAPASLIDEEIPASDAKVPMESLLRVFHHGERHRGDSHRFAVTSDPEDTMSKERIAGVYQELDSESCKPVLYSTLIEHPVIQDILSRFHRFKAPEIKQIISSQVVDNTDSQSMKTID
ncbi:sperm flagellar protein 2-like, partial [Tubulanus polymorphus]|uniref:sperm flagellar protein 2-like n=1 Tax=Tubulanus polymorphus TaxID=672921 RepID=UPI003DA5A988